MSHDRFHRACGHLWGVRVGALCLFLASPALAMASDKAAGPKLQSAPQPASQAQVVAAYGKLPLSFEANQGQTDPRVKFLSRGRGYGLFLTGDEAVLVLRKLSAISSQPSGKRNAKLEKRKTEADTQIPTVLRMRLLGANRDARVTGLDELPGKSNYFLGNDPKQWRTNVPNYAKVAYKNVYPGVDLVYYGNQGRLEYDFVVAPGADPKAITLEIETGNSKLETRQSSVVSSQLSVAPNGDLVIATDEGEIRLHKPLVYQLENPKSPIQNRRFLDGRYVVRPARPDLAKPKSNPSTDGENPKYEVAFEIGKYDARRPLIIDPVLSYSTYLGGSGADLGYGIAVDSSGNAYVTGRTFSSDFPTASPLQPANAGINDAFVAKFNASGTALIYSTYLGGTGHDAGRGISVDSLGNAYVTGETDSTDFPTANPFQPAFAGGLWDGFVTKLDATGSMLAYSTYMGGTDRDYGTGIAADSSGSAYVIGYTSSTDFPTANPFQPASAGSTDAFVAKLDASGTALNYSTYLGGSSGDWAYGIAVGSSGDAYVTGLTYSTDFPTTPGALDTACGTDGTCNGGLADAFVTKLNSTGSGLTYSTYLGAGSEDWGWGIAVDSSGNAYVTGHTRSTDFPVIGAFQVLNAGGNDAFVAKLDSAGSSLIFSSYLGGSLDDRGFGIAVDSAGNAYVTGRTQSEDFPTANALQPALGGTLFGTADGFVAKLNPAGSALIYSSYLGGSDDDRGNGVAVDSSGNAYVAGYTSSSDFPTTPGAYDTTCGTDGACNAGAATPLPDAFVVKLSGLALPVVTLSPTTLNFGSLGVGFTSAPLTVTLTNAGDATLIFTSFNVQSDLGPPPWSPVDFTQSNDCGASRAAGASCTLTVLFRPTATGSRTAVLVIVDNAAGSPHWVDLTAVGFAAPAVSLSVGSLDFGYQPVGSTSAPQPVTLTNAGTAALTISSITAPADFAQTNDCGTLPAVLGIGGICTINVTFTPSAEGFVIDFLSITDDAPGSPHQVALFGTGTAYPVPLIHQPVVPMSAVPGGAGFTLTVNGTGFFSNSVVKWNGSARATAFVSSTRLTATIPASDIATAGTAWVTVVNPTPGGGTSNVVFFQITNPTSIVSLARTDLPTGINPRAVAAADLNGDGKVDLAVANHGPSKVSVLIGNGDGTFQVAVDYATGTNPNAVTARDFNGDGVLDLAVANLGYAGPGSVSVLLGNGDGTFQPQVVYGVTGNAYAMATGDFNRDGALDLAVPGAGSSGVVGILVGNGDGTFQPHIDYDVGPQPYSLAIGDFNGDNKLDLAVPDAYPGTVSILLGNGDGTFQPRVEYALVAECESVVTADLNGDGKLDLAAANFSTSGISVRLGNGDGTFQAPVDYGLRQSWYSVTSGDFDGDGRLDLAAVRWTTNAAYIFLGNGGGTFQTPIVFPTGSDPMSLASGDFNSDGRLDLAVANTSSDSVSILFQAPMAGLSPAELLFGDQVFGTSSAAQRVTVTNNGSAELNVTGIAFSGTNAGDFAQTNTCSAGVDPGANCTIEVTFTPAAVGARAANFTITTNAPGSPHVVSLSGTGIVGPAASLSPSSVEFLRHPLNIVDCPAIDVTLANTGDAPLAITGIAVSANFSKTHTCGASLAAGANCKISVKFSPPGLGTTLGTLTVTSDAPGSPHTVALSGTGTAACRLLTSARSATVLRGTDSTSFGVSDSSPSCSAVPIELSCSLQNPAACALNPATIPPSGGSTLKVSNLRSVAAEWVTVVVNAVGEFRWASESLTVLISDFAFTRAPERATVRAGEATSYALAIRPVNGLAGTVRLSCGGAPKGATCTVAPSAVTLDGSSLGQATVRVTTTARALAGPGTQLRPPVGTPRDLPLVLGLMSLAALATLGTRRRRAWVVLSFSLLLVLVWAACGGGGSMSTSPGSGTPAGTYMLTVTGTYTVPSGDVELTHDTTVTLTVN